MPHAIFADLSWKSNYKVERKQNGRRKFTSWLMYMHFLINPYMLWWSLEACSPHLAAVKIGEVRISKRPHPHSILSLLEMFLTRLTLWFMSSQFFCTLILIHSLINIPKKRLKHFYLKISQLTQHTEKPLENSEWLAHNKPEELGTLAEEIANYYYTKIVGHSFPTRS